MQLTFNFEKINLGPNNKRPEIKITINNATIYVGVVKDSIMLDQISSLDNNQLEIAFLNKEHSDTVCNQTGDIIDDMNFSLSKIIIDDNDLEELIWQGQYCSLNNDVYPSCLFFGPPGRFDLLFEYPILRWILKVRNDLNHNDPNWEEDYNYYTTACKILNNL